MAKSKTTFICENCGHVEPKWTGKCADCGEWNTFVESQVIAKELKVSSGVGLNATESVPLTSAVNETKERFETGFNEFDRVLGGGIVEDEAILISGEPGVGKSTLLMQVCIKLSKDKNIIYISGEESAGQIASRANRLSNGSSLENILLLNTSNISVVISELEKKNPELVVIDSIQTMIDPETLGVPGGVAQVKSIASKIISYTKSKGIILIIVGHINKEGSIAGPKVLEHLVDCVLQFEGDRNNDYRILRALKNRFGTVGEVGIFSMTSSGLMDLDVNTNNVFSVTGKKPEVGTARTLIVEGDRPILLDIQLLANNTIFPYPKRISEGVSLARMQLLCAIMDNFKLTNTSAKDVYLKTSANYKLKDYPYADLGIAAALYSAVKRKPIDSNLIFIGEVGLNGRVVLPVHYDKYLKEMNRIFPESKIVTASGFDYKNIISVSGIQQISKILS